MKYKYFGLFFASVIVAFLVAKAFNHLPHPKFATEMHQDLIESDKHFKNLVQKINLLSDEEFKEYLELKDQNKKNQKADQLLANFSCFDG